MSDLLKREGPPGEACDHSQQGAQRHRCEQRVRRAAVPEGRPVRDAETERDDVGVRQERERRVAQHQHRQARAPSAEEVMRAPAGHADGQVSERGHGGGYQRVVSHGLALVEA